MIPGDSMCLGAFLTALWSQQPSPSFTPFPYLVEESCNTTFLCILFEWLQNLSDTLCWFPESGFFLPPPTHPLMLFLLFFSPFSSPIHPFLGSPPFESLSNCVLDWTLLAHSPRQPEQSPVLTEALKHTHTHAPNLIRFLKKQLPRQNYQWQEQNVYLNILHLRYIHDM